MSGTLGTLNPFRYRGYVYDEESGLYYLRSRYYRPEWGRFICSDTLIGEVGSELTHNAFLYCWNNPINLTDDDGNWPNWGQIIAAVAVTALCVVTAGAAAVALGASSAVVTTVMGATAVGGVVQGTLSVVEQSVYNDGDIDMAAVVIDTVAGSAYGASQVLPPATGAAVRTGISGLKSVAQGVNSGATVSEIAISATGSMALTGSAGTLACNKGRIGRRLGKSSGKVATYIGEILTKETVSSTGKIVAKTALIRTAIGTGSVLSKVYSNSIAAVAR